MAEQFLWQNMECQSNVFSRISVLNNYVDGFPSANTDFSHFHSTSPVVGCIFIISYMRFSEYKRGLCAYANCRFQLIVEMTWGVERSPRVLEGFIVTWRRK